MVEKKKIGCEIKMLKERFKGVFFVVVVVVVVYVP